MVASPTTVPSGTRVGDAVTLLGDAEVQRAAGGRPQRPAGRAGRRDRRGGAQSGGRKAAAPAKADEAGESGEIGEDQRANFSERRGGVVRDAGSHRSLKRARRRREASLHIIIACHSPKPVNKIELILSDVDGVMTDGGISPAG